MVAAEAEYQQQQTAEAETADQTEQEEQQEVLERIRGCTQQHGRLQQTDLAARLRAEGMPGL